jgi:hypothetical protein
MSLQNGCRGDQRRVVRLYILNNPFARCQSAFKFAPGSASNFDPLERRVRAVALAPSELADYAAQLLR